MPRIFKLMGQAQSSGPAFADKSSRGRDDMSGVERQLIWPWPLTTQHGETNTNMSDVDIQTLVVSQKKQQSDTMARGREILIAFGDHESEPSRPHSLQVPHSNDHERGTRPGMGAGRHEDVKNTVSADRSSTSTDSSKHKTSASVKSKDPRRQANFSSLSTKDQPVGDRLASWMKKKEYAYAPLMKCPQ